VRTVFLRATSDGFAVCTVNLTKSDFFYIFMYMVMPVRLQAASRGTLKELLLKRDAGWRSDCQGSQADLSASQAPTRYAEVGNVVNSRAHYRASAYTEPASVACQSFNNAGSQL
jgi:hypothetical protein